MAHELVGFILPRVKLPIDQPLHNFLVMHPHQDIKKTFEMKI